MSLLSETILNLLKQENDELSMDETEEKNIRGIDRGATRILGVTELKLKMLDIEMEDTTTFAVTSGYTLPCCCLLGANFLSKNNITINFQSNYLYMKNINGELIYPIEDLDCVANDVTPQKSMYTCALSQPDRTDQSGHRREKTVKLILSNEKLKLIQNKDHAIRLLKSKINREVPLKL